MPPIISPKQIDYINYSTHRWNVKTGATRSGKTYLDVLYTIPRRITERRGKDGLAVLLGNTRGTLQRNVLDPMAEIYGPQRVGSIRSDNTAMLFGEKVYCLGADNKKHVDRLRGSSIKYCYGDEVTTWAEDVFTMLKSRLDKQYSCFDGTCNPDNPRHWFKAFLDSDVDVYKQAYVIDDNPFLPPEFVTALKREYAGTVYYDRYILGLWALAEGVIYPMYPDALADDSPHKFSRYLVSLDYGTQNPLAGLLWGECSGVWYAFKEYYYSGRDTGRPKTDEEYADDIDVFMNGVPYETPVIVDPSAASFITLMRRRNRTVRPADNDVSNGIRETATAMKMGRIKVYKTLANFQKEIVGYIWDGDTDRPIKVDDHLMDALRYFVKTMRISRIETSYHSVFGG